MHARTWFEDPRSILKRHGFAPKKSWGQNFLISPAVIEKIAAACVDQPGRHVLEIGAGVGPLTAALLHMGADVTAIERDPDMQAVLRAEFANRDNFRLEAADAAAFDYAGHLALSPGVIAGNLPYQITGRILRRVTESTQQWLRAVFMVQLEVAERMTALPHTPQRGAMTVLLDARCHVRTLFSLPPTVFFPPPKVRSAVVLLEPRQEMRCSDALFPLFERVVKAAFSTRRKTLRNALRNGNLGDAHQVLQVLQRAEISPEARAEELDTAQFVSLAQAAETVLHGEAHSRS
ncbi:MAG: ribosomal RNA small subunit methyltransferase A [Myxococcales bacterium]|jgi:16S rRNA (adenine1518-N6/adenine1519-N6)-dimethyltransferase|nr:ribosomal RNA small subunit methyltransferase A [Myxococcales bacterium]